MDEENNEFGFLKMISASAVNSALEGLTLPIINFTPPQVNAPVSIGYDAGFGSDISSFSQVIDGRFIEPVEINVDISSAGGQLEDVALICQPKVEVDDDAFEFVEIHDRKEAVRRGNHCGWCTASWRNTDYQDRYQKKYGRLFVLYRLKEGSPKRRPSYQLFVSKQGNVEFQKKGSVSIDPWAFVDGLSDQSTKDRLLELLPDRAIPSPTRYEVAFQSRQMGRTMAASFALIQQRLSQYHEDTASVISDAMPEQKSFKKRKPIDQLIQSRLAKVDNKFLYNTL